MIFDNLTVCHFSDFNGRRMKLPKADVYVCTGNMFPDFSQGIKDEKGRLDGFERSARYVRPKQAQYIREMVDFRRYLGISDTPVVVCRGSRDFIPLAGLFGGNVYEIGKKPEITRVFVKVNCNTSMTLSFAGYRGCMTPNQDACDELTIAEEQKVARELSHRADIIVTHAPPHGILDKLNVQGETVGLRGLRAFFGGYTQKNYVAPLHCFGQATYNFGTALRRELVPQGESEPKKLSGPIRFSNASFGYQCYRYSNQAKQFVPTTMHKAAH